MPQRSFLLALLAGAAAPCGAFLAPSPLAGLGHRPVSGLTSRVSCRANIRLPASSSLALGGLRAASEGASSRPQPGELGASDLVKYLWTEAQYFDDYPECSIPFFADDVVYEDMIYKDPFVGKPAVEVKTR